MLFRMIPDLLPASALAEVNRIADAARFVDGRITNPHNAAKQNVQLGDRQAWEASARILSDALNASEDFRNLAFPRAVAPPLVTAYGAGHRYGLHADAPFMALPGRSLRSDLSCTIFLGDPDSYDGGALRIVMGDAEVSLKGPAGAAVVYPSTTMHEVTPVTRGTRRVAITFIESRIADPHRRELLYELNEVAALEGLGMAPANFNRLQRVQSNLLRMWGEAG